MPMAKGNLILPVENLDHSEGNFFFLFFFASRF